MENHKWMLMESTMNGTISMRDDCFLLDGCISFDDAKKMVKENLEKYPRKITIENKEFFFKLEIRSDTNEDFYYICNAPGGEDPWLCMDIHGRIDKIYILK